MGDKTGIEWTDATWNPVVGCSIVSPGCTNCYAMKQADSLVHRFGPEKGVGAKYAGLTKRVNGKPVWTGVVRLDGNALVQPLHWRKPRRIFVNSMSDLFHENLSDDAIDKVFAVMALCPQHTFQVLTKRAERMRGYFAEKDRPLYVTERMMDIDPVTPFHNLCACDGKDGDGPWPLPNVWLGVSVEDQACADKRIPLLLQTPAAKRFLSCEPLLGQVDLTEIEGGYSALDDGADDGVTPGPVIDWVIAGGESGSEARPMHPDWARSLRDQCHAAGVPFFFKQWGEWTPVPCGGRSVRPMRVKERNACPVILHPHGDMVRVGKKAAGRLLDGREWSEFPASGGAA